MDLPALISQGLSPLKSAKDESELFDLLIKNTRELTEFFESAADDETWSSNHSKLMQKLIEHLSQLFIEDNLSMELTFKAASVVKAHSRLLLPKVPNDLGVNLKDGKVTVNALLFSSISPLFNNLALSADHQKNHHEIFLPKVQKIVFDVVKNFSEEGKVEDLWRHEYATVLDVYTFSIEWEIKELQIESVNVLKRYITKQNYLSVLRQTMQNGWQEYYLCVLSAANTYDLGVIFHEMPLDFLKIEFLDFREAAMDLFDALKDKITHLGFFGAITDDSRFTKVIMETKGLIGITLNEIKEYNDRLLDIPNTIEELDLAMNPWVTSSHIKSFIQQCPDIKRLSLKSLVNIDFKSLGCLKETHLESLILTKCSQLSDADLVLICQSCPDLLQLDLEGCERLTDRALETISRFLTKLEELNLSRLQISDVGLIDLCHRLKRLYFLNLERCLSISDKGILESVQVCPSLRKLVILHTQVSPGAKNQLHKIRPSLEFI